MANASALNYLSKQVQANEAAVSPATPEAKLMAEMQQHSWLPLEQVPGITGLERADAGRLVEKLRATGSVVLRKTDDDEYILSM